jgi:hypothetical protein
MFLSNINVGISLDRILCGREFASLLSSRRIDLQFTVEEDDDLFMHRDGGGHGNNIQ